MATNNQNLGELLPIKESNGSQAVNARDLHSFLEIGKDFSTWMKDQIEKCDLTENQDYEVLLPKKGEQTGRGGHNKIEYALSLNAAKEISMMSQTERGKEARRYFIACEAKLKEIVSSPQLPSDYLSALKALVASEEEKQQLLLANEQQKAAIEKLEEMTAYTRMVLKSTSTVLVTQIAQDYGMSAIKFNATLRDLNIQRKVGTQWILYSKFLDKGYVQSETKDITHKDGTPDVVLTTKWTQKGRLFLYQQLKKHGILPMIEQNILFQEGGSHVN